MFGNLDSLLLRLYIGTFLLLLMSATTICFILFVKDPYFMIIAFIITEVCMQFMLLWLLKQFISKLSTMLNFSLKTVNPLKTDLSLYKNFRKMLGDNLSKRRLDECQSNDQPSQDEPKARIPISMDHDAEFVNIMSKMTLLVMVGVVGCTLSIFGHIFIARYGYQNVQQSTTWMILESFFILFPIIDRLMASFMLYLQFKQTERVYLALCAKMDDYVLLCGLKCVQWKLKRNHIKYNEDVNVRTLSVRHSPTPKSKDKSSSHLELPKGGRASSSSHGGHGSSHSSGYSVSISLSLPGSANLDAIVEEENIVETPTTTTE